MTIGEALSYIQHNRKLTEEEMIKGVIRKGTYSKVIHGKQNLSAPLLIKILLINKIDINYFLSLIKKDYSSETILEEVRLSQRMGLALNNHKIEDAEKCLQKIKKLGTNPFLEQRATIAVYFLKNKIEDLSPEFKNLIIKEFNKNDNWILNLDMLRLFGTAMMILPQNEVELEMQLFFVRYGRMKRVSPDMMERYAILCSNYLHWKYVNNKKLDSNTIKSISFLQNLPKTPHMFLYMITGTYYCCLFNKEINKAKKVKENLLDLGCTVGVNNWPI